MCGNGMPRLASVFLFYGGGDMGTQFIGPFIVTHGQLYRVARIPKLDEILVPFTVQPSLISRQGMILLSASAIE